MSKAFETEVRAWMSKSDERMALVERALVVLLDEKAPAAAVVPVAPKVTKVTTKPVKKAKCLTRKNRLEFVKVAPWAKGLSTSVIAHMCVEDATLIPAGWAIGEGRRAMCA